MTNLTGHPCVVLPNGFTKEGAPTSITFTGKLFGEATVLAVAKAYQDATNYHLQHPVLEE
jgi:Asp-tRNA(Asn)/Glu-tRNA(Gln) amidotransferase A subunit family amidase